MNDFPLYDISYKTNSKDVKKSQIMQVKSSQDDNRLFIYYQAVVYKDKYLAVQ
jgi:hypothetical protein